MAYERKQWAMDNLCKALLQHSATLGITWGWKHDLNGPKNYQHVLYIETPTGQISFHNAYRGQGPDYSGEWDGIGSVAPHRICLWIEQLTQAAVAA
jgi:hypothetical protein